MPPNVSSALRSRSTASCERRSGKPARSWRWPILAVVLLLFAHSEASAQQAKWLETLTVTGTVGGGGAAMLQLSPTFAENRLDYTVVTADNSPVSLSALASLRVVPGAAVGYRVESYDPRPTVTSLPLGRTVITVTVEDIADTTQTRDYTVTVTRLADTTIAELTIGFPGGDYLTDESLKPPEFEPATRSYTAIVTAATTQATFTVIRTTSPTAEVTWDRGPGGLSHTRNLGTGLNTITATVRDGTSTGDYTFRVTLSDTPGAPRNVRATAPRVGQEVTLSWSAPSDDGDAPIDYYEVVHYHEFEVFNAEDPTDSELTSRWMRVGDVLSHRVTDLFNGTTYYVRVRARNQNGEGNGSNDASATPAGPPLAPVLSPPAETALGNGRVELTWTRPPESPTPTQPGSLHPGNPISSYEYSQDGSWRSIPNSDESTTSYTATGLRNGTSYEFRVRARNRAGIGRPSNRVRAEPKAFEPGAPTNLTPTAGDSQVTLAWSAPRDNGGERITGYQYWVGRETNPNPGRNAVGTATGGTGTTVTVHTLADETPLQNTTTYYFRVRAVNGLGCVSGSINAAETRGCGQWSLEVSATPVGKPVTRIASLDAMSDEDSRVELMWTLESDPPPDADRSGFQYRQRAGSGFGSWIDVRNSNASTTRHVVTGLMNGTTYTFEVRAVNSAGGGLASDEAEAVPSIPPGAPTLRATPGDDQVSLTWTPAANGGRRIIRYECQWRAGAADYGTCPHSPLGASATSLTLTYDDGIRNGTTYTFRVLAVNARPTNADGDWSNEVSVRPTDGSVTERRFTISATINGKSWAKAGERAEILATVEVNPRFTAQSTGLQVTTSGGGFIDSGSVNFGPTNSSRDIVLEQQNPTYTPPSTYVTIALFEEGVQTNVPSNAVAVTRVEIRHGGTPAPPTGLVATRENGGVTLSWATVLLDGGAIVDYDYDYRQKRQAGSYGRWTDFAGRELQSTTVTSNTVTGLTDGGTYAFQVRAVAVTVTGSPPTRVRVANAESDPSDEVRVSLSGTVETGGLSAPRNLDAAAGDGRVTLSWTAPAADGGAAISGYQYQRRAGAGAYGQWTTIPGGPSVRSFIVTGLTNGTRYFFRVRAVNSDGEGPGSTEESATPLLGVDTTLRTLSLSTVALAPVTLTPAFTPATRTYTATVTGSVTQVTVAATANKAGARETITPADASTAVAGHQVALAVGLNTIRVTVADGNLSGVYTIRVTRAARVPAAPTGLTAATAEDGGGAVTLSWTAPTGGGAVSRYEYQQKAGTDAYGAWTPIPGSGPSTTSHTVTGLTNGTAYAFRVRAVNSVGNGAASNEATATPALVRLVWAKTEREVADTITAARNAGYGDDMTFTAGETVVVRGSALFNAAEGVSLTFTTTSDDTDAASAAASDGTVTVTARAAGMATITITAQASRPSGVTIVEQTDPREASITFPVEVGLEALTLELSGPSDGTNLVEGGRRHPNGTVGTVTVTVEANRPVTEDVTVTLLIDRAMSDNTATADDFEADPIVIEAGETRGSTVVTAEEDGTAEKMEELVLFGLAEGNAGTVTGEVRLRLWDAAVPVLPVVAQLLLGAFLAIGGYRRYRRR